MYCNDLLLEIHTHMNFKYFTDAFQQRWDSTRYPWMSSLG